MKSIEPLAVLCSDLHLQERAPVSRSAEPDWWAAMKRPIDQLKALAQTHQVPIVCAGDVFDHWKSSPELINWALEHLPIMYSVPGQHDLPLHRYEDVDKSAYGTLVRFGTLIPLPSGEPTVVSSNLVLWGFPWQAEISPHPKPKKIKKDEIHLAVIHAYCWQKGASYPGAKEEQRAISHRSKLTGFHAAVFGDNHKPFLSKNDEGPVIFNHGGFMRRKIDEIDHRPAFGILWSDGSISLVEQDVSQDVFLQKDAATFEEGDNFKMATFLKDLGTLGGADISFKEAVAHYLRTYEVSEGAQKIILKAIHT